MKTDGKNKGAEQLISLPFSEQHEKGFSLEVVCHSEKMKEVMGTLAEMISTSANILLIGETGAGKEHIARAFHSQSRQKYGPFLSVDCLTMLSEILELELFGQKSVEWKGNQKIIQGAFERVSSGEGILFLRHFEDLSSRLQSKLLHIFHIGKSAEKGDTGLGGKEPKEKEQVRGIPRIVFSAGKSLLGKVQRGEFCTELFSQIGGDAVIVEIPPLRERKEDIIPLMEHFLKMKTHNENFSFWGKLSGGVLHCLLDYNWPGNVDELSNLCDILPHPSEGEIIKVGDLPEQMRKNKTFLSDSDSVKVDLKSIEQQILGIKIGEPRMTLDDLEKNYILHSLQFFEGNKTRTATVLGITVKTLYNKLNRYGFQK